VLILTVILLILTVSCKTPNSRRYVCDVWGRVGGIVKTICAICFELRTINYLSGTPVHFCTYSGTCRLVYEATIKYVTSEACGLKSQGHFQVANIINRDWIGKVFQLQYSYVTLIRCVCVSRYSATDMWFHLYSKQLNTA
jgi:hypothetical protein